MIKIKVGTRNSALALKQANLVKSALEKNGVDVEIVEVVSTGDKIQNKPLWDIGGKGLFCAELDSALLNGDIDIAVHSAKDMETKLVDGIEIYGALPREDVRDVFISKYKLNDLPSGAVIGTCSLRRQSQILNINPNVEVKSIRGNVETRLQKVESGEFDGTFLAMAGLNRLGIDTANWQILPKNEFIPSAGQGIIAICGRTENPEIKTIVEKINDNTALLQLSCERAFLTGIDGNCKTPVGAYAEIIENEIKLQTFYGKIDGSEIDKTAKTVKSATECEKLGIEIKQKYPFFD